MTRYLLDSNVISNITKASPSVTLTHWLTEQADDSLFVASLVIAEIWFGILECPDGKERALLEKWFAGPEGQPNLFAGRIPRFDERAGLAWPRLMSDGERSGRSRSALDMMLAAIAEVNECTVATDNERDFCGLRFINPTRAQG